MDINTIIQRNIEIDATDMDGEKVMMNLDKGQYFSLNSVASDIWDIIENPMKIDEVVDKLLQEYEVDRETCEKSVIEFVEEMNNAGLITLC